ncbi:MAG: insulinase family protein [Nitrospira sp.]|nr:MAG: insulinase family protein [Nitrospira sp.]
MSSLYIGLLCAMAVLAGSTSAGASEVQEFTLANGMKVLLREVPKAPVATVQIWYKVGSRDEVMGRAGLSHMLEHMMFKGTPQNPKGAFSRTIRKNGGNDNAFTSQDYTGYFENMAADRVGLALELEADRLRGLLLDDKEFQLEREVVKEERRMSTEDDPQSYLVEAVFAQAFQQHPYHWPIIGWFPDLNAMTREDLQRHYDTYYVPNNATLIVVGDIQVKTLLPTITRLFASIPARAVPTHPIPEEPEQKGERRILVKRDAQLPFVLAAYRAPNFKHEDSYALALLESLLAQGKSARLYRSLVYEQKIALAVGTDHSLLQTDPQLFYCYVVVAPGQKVDAAEQALYRELDRIKQEPPSELELQRAKNQLEAGRVFGQDSIFRQAMMLGQAETVGAGWKFEDSFLDRVRRVTPHEVQRVAQRYLIEDARTVGILVPTPPVQPFAETTGGTRP